MRTNILRQMFAMLALSTASKSSAGEEEATPDAERDEIVLSVGGRMLENARIEVWVARESAEAPLATCDLGSERTCLFPRVAGEVEILVWRQEGAWPEVAVANLQDELEAVYWEDFGSLLREEHAEQFRRRALANMPRLKPACEACQYLLVLDGMEWCSGSKWDALVAWETEDGQYYAQTATTSCGSRGLWRKGLRCKRTRYTSPLPINGDTWAAFRAVYLANPPLMGSARSYVDVSPGIRSTRRVLVDLQPEGVSWFGESTLSVLEAFERARDGASEQE